ncbi:MAG: FtsQ-type POTRA domain-containing protein [Deinococcales bacterium]
MNRKRYRRMGLGLLLLLLSLFVVSYRYPRIEQIVVAGNHHHSREKILELARVQEGQSLFWVTAANLHFLAQDPWVKDVILQRHMPHELFIMIEERTPYAQVKLQVTDLAHDLAQGGSYLYAADGTQLMYTVEDHPELLQISGWGEERLEEALQILKLLSVFSPKMLHYNPSGFEVTLSQSKLFTPNIKMLQEHWTALSSQGIALSDGSYQLKAQQISLYPWGVSVQ